MIDKETLDYIEERTRSIKHNSKKLREVFMQLKNIFGDKEYCQICFNNVDPEKHNAEYLRQHGNDVTDEELAHQPIPKIECNLPEPIVLEFYTINKGETKYRELRLDIDNTIFVYLGNGEYLDWDNVSNETIKTIIKEELFIKLIDQARLKLIERDDDFRIALETVEKMLAAVRPQEIKA